MFTLFVDSLVPSDVEKYNDAFFDLHLGDVDFTSPNVVNLIKEIDGVSYVDNHRITSKFDKKAQIRVEELSTGCKTALNICSHIDKIFYIGECGENALTEIFKLKEGKAFLTYFSTCLPFVNQIQIKSRKGTCIIHNDTELTSILYDIC